MLFVKDKDLNLIAAYRYLEEHPEDDGVEWEEGARVFQLDRGGVSRELTGAEADRARSRWAAIL